MVAINTRRRSLNSSVKSVYRRPTTWIILLILLLLFIPTLYIVPWIKIHKTDFRTIRKKAATVTKSFVPCKYHGNCPIGTSCVKKTSMSIGECRQYKGPRNDTLVSRSSMAARTKPTTSINSTSQLLAGHLRRHDLCVSTCWDELQWDEYFYHRSTPIIQQTYLARNGHGCVLTYQRKRAQKPTNAPSLEERMAIRFQRVVRVDPVEVEDSTSLIWQALCNAPCQTKQDCDNDSICVSNSEGGKKSCQKESLYPQENNNNDKHENEDMVIVTGANTGYFEGLKNFAASVKFWASQHKLVVYNLGMTAEQLAEVKSWSVVHKLHWEDGIPTSYPSHVRNNLKNYAWKPIIINETVHQYKSIFWLDAGATLVGPIQPIQDIVHQTGLFLVRGQDDDMKYRSHPGTYTALGFDKTTFQGGDHFAGGIQGHVHPSRYIDTIVRPNAECAMEESCIAPPGSNFENHRYDQTSLSILAYQFHVAAPSHTEYLAASRTQLMPNMSESNHMILWTARNSCQYYSELGIL